MLGRELQAVRVRILDLQDEAELRTQADPRHAQAFRAQAETQAAALVAQGAALRDEIIARARGRAKWAWRVAYAGIAAIVALCGWWWLWW